MLRANGANPQAGEHGELILADAVPPVVPGEHVEPVQLHVEHLEQRLAARRAPLQQLARGGAALVAEVRDQQPGHLPAVARLLRHVAHEPPAVVLARGAVEELARLLDRAHLRVALPDDEPQQLVLDLGRRDVGDALPAPLAGVAAEGDFRIYL